MAVNTIDDVISNLDDIIQQAWDRKSRLGYFAALYRRITRAVRDGISQGQFENGILMEQLDVAFAKRYLDALSTHQSGGSPSLCWRETFLASDDGSRLILQHLLAGINSHINLDLGVASAQVSPGDQLRQLKADFDQVNAMLALQVGAVESEMAALSPLMKDLSKVGLKSQTTLINFNIGLARSAAWFVAQRLASEPSILHEVSIRGLDLAVSVGGRTILYPPCNAVALAAIRAAEVEDVRNVIEILARQ